MNIKLSLEALLTISLLFNFCSSYSGESVRFCNYVNFKGMMHIEFSECVKRFSQGDNCISSDIDISEGGCEDVNSHFTRPPDYIWIKKVDVFIGEQVISSKPFNCRVYTDRYPDVNFVSRPGGVFNAVGCETTK